MKALITREKSDDKQTLGKFQLTDSGNVIFDCFTLELDWEDNKKQKSCIPKGKYKVVPRKSPKFGNHFHILNVPNRDYILIHAGNYHTQILGCVLVGQSVTDINNDGYKDVTASKITLNKILALSPNGFELEIK